MSLTKRTLAPLLLGALVGIAPAARGQEAPREPTPEERAVLALERAGATVVRDEKAPGRPVTEIHLSDPFEGAELEALRVLPRLKRLTLNRREVPDGGPAPVGLAELTDAELAPVAGLTGLEALDISGAKVTDAGLALLKRLTRLQELTLARLPITDAGLAHLRGLARLESLRLTDVPITDAGLAHLNGLPSLHDLSLSRVRVTGPGLVHLSRLPRLEWLTVHSAPVTDTGLANMKRFPRLRIVHLWETKVTGAGVSKLKEALPYTLIDVGGQGWSEVQPVEDPRSALL
jgi:hypothetical protein